MTTDDLNFTVALALGSNLGDRQAALQKALNSLKSSIDIRAVSPVYETHPAYVLDQPLFLNAVVVGTTKIEPLALLWTVKDIEREIGREPTYRYGPRVIDIDILTHGTSIINTPELILPHARLHERGFVLRPLSDAAPEWRHPVSGKSAQELLDLLPPKPMTCLGPILS